MNDAIWAVIGDVVPVMCGVLLAMYVLVGVLVALLDGLRVDRWRAFSARGVIAGLTKKDRSRQ
jgi:hypothetical protein